MIRLRRIILFRMKLRGIIFHPITVLCIALSATLVFASVIVMCSHGRRSFHSLYYVAPIGVPFIAFLFERCERFQKLTRSAFLVDSLTIGLAAARAEIAIPWLSGHSLFLTYAFLTSKTLVVRVTALIVMIQVLYLKLFVWGDFEVLGGIVLGIITSVIFRTCVKRRTS